VPQDPTDEPAEKLLQRIKTEREKKEQEVRNKNLEEGTKKQAIRKPQVSMRQSLTKNNIVSKYRKNRGRR
jgi:hypothetical protein